MFKEMRRYKQQLPPEKTIELLNAATSGVLAVQGPGGYPYAVPLSFVYHQGKLYIHCATQGQKLEAIAQNPKVSFCVIGRDDVVPEKYTTHYSSVILFGKAIIVQDDTQKRAAIELLAEKYYPGHSESHHQAIEKSWANFCVVEIEIEQITGKATLGMQ